MAKMNPLRWGEGRKAKQTAGIVAQVGALAKEFEAKSDDELKAMTVDFKQRLDNGASLDDLLPEAFATVRESAWRVLGQRPYDVQIFGGIVLHNGNIAEMKTGEGKTLTSTMPVYLNGLLGAGIHIVTVNPYLAQRDSEWMGRLHNWLGLTVGLVSSQQPKEAKRLAYEADITYGTNNEFGFDYLRDNMAWDKPSQVQRGHYMALIDEVDSILVDEARTPLIISGAGEQSAQWYQIFARRVAPNLTRGEEGRFPGETTGDYVVDEAKRNVGITEQGVHKVEQILNMGNLYESVNTPLIQHLQNSLKAKELFKRDREYIVDNGEVKIVDEHTGRVLEGRRYSEGLHQSIEAKEEVRVKEENQTLATVTLQNYYRTYDKLAGMTGTAKTEEVEFLEIYDLGVVEVPTNRPIVRKDEPDLIFKTEAAKFEAVAQEIEERNANGQPILIGTTSVERSEHVARLLSKRGVPHNVLNAKNHGREAHVVAQAGAYGAVTVSTNMAGRGTDIILGGNPEELARDAVAKLPPEATDEERATTYKESFAKFEAECKDGQQKVLDAGGLFVIGTERHESRRIDNQLRGRSGRQGDAGESRFFLSLEDDLMRLFNATAVEKIMTRLKIPEDVPIEHKWVTKAVANAQRQVESRNFDIRKNVLKYDDVLNEQRKVVYSQRQRLIEGDTEAVQELAEKYVDDSVTLLVDEHCPDGVYPEEWDLAGLEDRVKAVYPCTFDFAGIDLDDVERDKLVDALVDDVDRAYEARIEEVGGEEVMREVERRVILSIVDRKWREHLYEMDALRDGIGLRAVGQRDPLVEYQREAYESFVGMMASVKEESVSYFFHIPVKREDEEQAAGQPAQQGGKPAAGGPHSGWTIFGAAGLTGAAKAARIVEGVAEATNRQPATGGNGQPVTPAAAQPAAQATAGPNAAKSAPPKLDIGGPRTPQKLTYTAPDETAGTGAAGANYQVDDSAATTAASPPKPDRNEDGTTVRQVAKGGQYTADDKTGRNDPCPCGSGTKYKKCHGA